jgi:hypothetical protein
MRHRHGITGYAQYAVSGKRSATRTSCCATPTSCWAQYANHPELRIITNALLAWAAETDGVQIQLRKGHMSLHSARRKSAQIMGANYGCVDVTLRIEAPAEGLLKP